jgi:hypothetical protein
VGHEAKESIHIHDAVFNLYYYKNWVILKDLKVNNNISNFDLFGSYYQLDSSLDLHMEISLTDLFFRSVKKRMLQTDEGIFNLEKDLDLFLQLHGTTEHQKFNIRNKRKHNKARKDQIRFIRQVEEDFRGQVNQYYQNFALLNENQPVSSTLELSLD